jgi:hypothetical protein
MAITRSFNGALLVKPGAYPAIKVLNLTGFPLQPTGIVGVVGEAVGGKPGVLDVLQGQQIQAAKTRYKSGEVADALGILAAPSNDSRVAGGASTVIVYKTNNSTQATLSLNNDETVPAEMIELTTENYGDDENQLNAVVAAGTVADSDAALVGSIDGPFNLAGGETLIVYVNGVAYTYTGTLVNAAATAADLATELDDAGKWAPSKPVVAAVDPDNANRVRLDVDTATLTTAKKDYGYLEVDPTSTLDTIAGLTGEDRGVKGSRFITLVNGSEEEDALEEIGGLSALNIKYVGAGTDAKLTVQDSLGEMKLTTAVTGGPGGEDLDITLGVYVDGELRPKITLKQLADLINANAAYEASSAYPNPDLNALHLDFYTDINIERVALDLKVDVYSFVEFINTRSEFVTADRKRNVIGAVATFSDVTYFTGGSDGVSTNASWAEGFTALKGIRVNTVVPLISADKGSVSVDAVNALAKTHVLEMSTTKNKSFRNAYVSYLGSKDEVKDASRALGSARVSLLAQDVEVFSHSQQDLVFLPPWAHACVAAGMQAGSPVGEPTTFKLINVNDVRVRDGSWDPKIDGDEMLLAGVTISEPLDGGGFRIVLGNTTYGADPSFVYNRVSVVEAGDFVAYDLWVNLELVFTGTKARTGTAGAIANFIAARMERYLREDIIVGDDLNDGLGYKDLSVRVEGNTAFIQVTVTPVQGNDFQLPEIYLADIRQSA